MTLWYDPNKDLRTQVVAAFGSARFYDYATDYDTRTDDYPNGYVRVSCTYDGSITFVQNLPTIARLFQRFGWGFVMDGSTTCLYAQRRNPLLNEQVMANKAEIKRQYSHAKQEVERLGPLWASVKNLRAVVLDKRMVRAVVSMASRWPEVMNIAYDGDGFESFDGFHRAPADTISIRFWPVCYQQGMGTSGLTGVISFTIDAKGHVQWLSGSDPDGHRRGNDVHPHTFYHGGICMGSAERDFDSQIHSLATLRDWWVGTDHHPANADWASNARDWWEANGEAFFGYFEGGMPHMYQDVRPCPNPGSYGSGVFWRYEDLPVTDDGLDIPGLSLPEYTVPHGTPYYIVAPEQTTGYDVCREDKDAEAGIQVLDAETLEELLDEYNVVSRYNCHICGERQHEDDAYFCEYCDRHFCDRHYNGDYDMCDNCFEQRYVLCTECDTYTHIDDVRYCVVCDTRLCEDCAQQPDGAPRRTYYCQRHFEELEDDEEDPYEQPGMPGVTEGYRCGLHGNIACRLCAGPVLGLTRRIFIPERGRDYHCEARLETGHCAERATWRHETLIYDGPGWLCEDHYQAIPEAATPEPVAQEPTQYPVVQGWEALNPAGGLGGGLVCCHPECVPLNTPANYSSTDAAGTGRRVWPLHPTRGYIGEYACEAHVPRPTGWTFTPMAAEPQAYMPEATLADVVREANANDQVVRVTFTDWGEAIDNMPNFAEMESEEFWPYHEASLGGRWFNYRYPVDQRPTQEALVANVWAGGQGMVLNTEGFREAVIENEQYLEDIDIDAVAQEDTNDR